MTAETPVAREMAPVVIKKAPVTEQPERVIINEAKLRDIFDSPFMHEWVSDGKNNLDHVIEDLQFVRGLWVYEAAPETQGGRVPMPAFEKQYDPDGDIPVQGGIRRLDP